MGSYPELVRQIEDLELRLEELVGRQEALLADHAHLTERIRDLQSSEVRVPESAGSQGAAEQASVEVVTDGPGSDWTRLWEQQPSRRGRSDGPSSESSAGRAWAADPSVTEPERGPGFDPRRARVRGWLLVAIAAALVGGGVLILSRVVGSDRPSPAVVAVQTPTTRAIIPATMPNVLGARLPEATDLITEAGLQVTDIRFVPGRKGRVVATEPTVGEAVVVGTDVSLSIGTG